jgi:hypothetical protein
MGGPTDDVMMAAPRGAATARRGFDEVAFMGDDGGIGGATILVGGSGEANAAGIPDVPAAAAFP